MSTVKNDAKFWKWSVIMLILANTALLGYTLFKKEKTDHQGPGPKGESVSDLIIHELSLDEEQEKAFILLRNEHRDSMDILKEMDRQIRKEISGILTDTAAPDSLAVKLTIETGKIRSQMDLATYSHFKQVRKLCNEKQAEKFDAIIDEVMKRFSRPHGPPPHKKHH